MTTPENPLADAMREALAGVAEDRKTEGECPARIRDEIASDIRILGGVHD